MPPPPPPTSPIKKIKINKITKQKTFNILGTPCGKGLRVVDESHGNMVKNLKKFKNNKPKKSQKTLDYLGTPGRKGLKKAMVMTQT